MNLKDEILNEIYDIEVRRLKWKGVDCTIGLIPLILTVILPDIYTQLISGIFGIKSLGDGIKVLFKLANVPKKLKGVSDFWLPWYIKKEYDEK